MKLGRCTLKNFGSWRELEFDFSNKGLALIYGATGAGKSALLDAAVWILYGQTAKGGSVDDVRSWQANGSTEGSLEIQMGDGTSASVCRQRALRGGQNDCYWREAGDPPDYCRRGKDLADTQKLLQSRLGLSVDRFIASSYFHEFSPTGAFFSAPAKVRREVLEGLVDLSLAERIRDGSKRARSAAKQDAADLAIEGAKLAAGVSAAKDSLRQSGLAATAWDAGNRRRLEILTTKAKGFDKEKEEKCSALAKQATDWQLEHIAHNQATEDQINALSDSVRPPEKFVKELERLKEGTRCSKCGSLPETCTDAVSEVIRKQTANAWAISQIAKLKKELERTEREVNPYNQALSDALKQANIYFEQLAATKKEVNPHLIGVSGYNEQVKDLTKCLKVIQANIATANARLSALEQVKDLAGQLRSTLLYNTVRRLEGDTNRYLERFFDAEFRVGFTLNEDALDVSITKNGYACNYKQLSKGQRGLLKLCFVVSVMKATGEQSGDAPRQLFMDEALDGLDATLKTKAFGLFQELSQEYDSVFVVEHSPEFQQLFDNKYQIELVNDESQINS